MKTIYNIKPRDEFFVIFGEKITKYWYLCLMPSKNPVNESPDKYHIVINKNSEKPERWWCKDLEDALSKPWALSYELAKKEVMRRNIERLEEYKNNPDKYY